jgi:hypothetical protein
MKKAKQKEEKKLSLKKLQLMKITSMRTINGGNGGVTLVLNFNTGGDEPPTIRPKTFDTH